MMSILEPAREIPVADETEVLVLGGGPAGFSAAIASAREGMKTLLLEQSGDIGGVSTTGMMSHWTGNTRGGFYQELLDRSADYPEDVEHEGDFNGNRHQIINPEKLKSVYLEMLEEVGVSWLLYTMAVKPIMDGNRIIGVITESKAGRRAYLAKIVIDATGDGDIAAQAGVPYFIGRESDGKMQPVSIMFKVGGVDTDRAVFPGSFEDNLLIPEGPVQDVGKSHLPFPAGHVLLYRSSLPGVVTCNMTNCIDVNGTRPEDLSRATLTCRRQIEAIVPFLQKHVPGYEHCYLLSSASQIGVRETRHFMGEASIDAEDIQTARIFEDWAVTRAHFNFDVHNMSGNGLDQTGSQKNFSQNQRYTIPYGCLVPQKVDGLLLAGRDICGTHMAHSNYRVMPICANMGQSAGVAASLCVKNDLVPRKLPVRMLQDRLKELGIEP